MKILLRLTNYCIETATKKEYDRLICTYSAGRCSEKEKAVIEKQLDAVTFFLKQADFFRLRTMYLALSGYQKASVTLNIPANYHETQIVINDDRTIDTEWRNINE